MSSPYASLDDRPLEKWKVTELKEELKRRKLATKGLKEDLLKRLDEAIRSEEAQAPEDSDNDASESELPFEQAKVESGDSENAKDLTDVGIDRDEELDEEVEDDTNDDGRSLEESKVIEPAFVQGSKSAELEKQQVINKEVETMPTLSGSHLHIDEKNVDSDSTEMLKMVESQPLQEDAETELIHPKVESSQTDESVAAADSNSTAMMKVDELQPLQEDAKPEPADPKVEASQTNESVAAVEIPSKLNLQVNENQNESMQSTIHMNVEDSKCLQAESSHSLVQPLKHQVSEVDYPNLGLQATFDSLSTESVSINEKNELKVNAITDNVQLELDVKHEMVQLSPGSSVADGGTLPPVDVEEPCSKNDNNELLRGKDIEEPLSKKKYVGEPPHKKDLNDDINAENADTFKNIDGLVLCPEEKLSLDHSSGDDSMEEDRLESNKLEYKADLNKIGDNVEKSGMPMDKEDNHVDVVELKDVNMENTSASASTSVKRKFRDEGTIEHKDTVKKARRFNAESLEGSEARSGSTSAPITPKGLSEPTLKHSSGADHALNEAPKERIVPPSSKPPSNSLRIDRFLRPFTLKAVQELLGKTGSVTSFWMDHIKTHCYVSYSSVEEAVETRNAVYNLQWPPNGGRMLVAEFVDPQEVKARSEAPPAPPTSSLSGTVPNFSAKAQPRMAPIPSPRQQVPRLQLPLPPSLPPPPPLSNPALVQERLHTPREQAMAARDRVNLPPPPPPPAAAPNTTEMPILTLDDLFRKTKATPRIYYLPLSDEQVAARVKSTGNQ